ncbi:hypothetical protein NP493_213g01019 [Ridgeia piscesae]|uniref:Uncharacterized protein n=1 Tax=Ridgeia piscesae TaxID=27915 RepID=A0AAD9UE49_RIDPI|nr:hypothetical protein NP493_213g01019 [Ridgeia piscesae]
MRDKGVWRQTLGFGRVACGNGGQRSLEQWLESLELQVAMRDRGVWRQMVGVSRVASGNDGQRSLETDGWIQ